jgi:SET domain
MDVLNAAFNRLDLSKQSADDPASPFVHMKLIGTDIHYVITKENIPANTFIGVVDGVAAYSWDVEFPFFFVVDDDLVLDTTNATSVLAFMREFITHGKHSNCIIALLPNNRIGVYSLRDIAAGEELTYTAGRFIEV